MYPLKILKLFFFLLTTSNRGEHIVTQTVRFHLNLSTMWANQEAIFSVIEYVSRKSPSVEIKEANIIYETDNSHCEPPS